MPNTIRVELNSSGQAFAVHEPILNQVKDVSDADRDAPCKRIKAAAKKHGVDIKEWGWRAIGKG